MAWIFIMESSNSIFIAELQLVTLYYKRQLRASYVEKDINSLMS